ncbi:hypothetical protein GCM10007416_25530 [Kroppenstedtia guangzhouensis]|uniref:ATP-grasp domain-containing protein n=1 Tax=Kroppenstedtia guangzhouensis TaxID=1274356 RepID=A0ABQ1GWE4_9BACL|nr:YheC/YheD family protein [Kroppenstedtia guangzhouensis]GGA51305.1 hypothetical protein GCM10007416_25530 [Kroppenstedtia guangzhouensis]
MGHARIMIQILPERYFPPQVNMIVSQSLANRLQLPKHPIWAAFGTAADITFISTIQNQTPLVRIHSRLAEKLRITNQHHLNIRYDARNGALHFGPFLGILINEDVQGNSKQKFGMMARFLEECAQACASKGVALIVFPPEGIHLSKRTVRGWSYQGKKWELIEAPLPDTVYNRITSRRIERRQALQQKLSILRNIHQIPVFNETFLNKQQVHNLLTKDANMRPLLPETHLYHPKRLRIMLNRHRIVYLKPTNGSLGQGIIRVTAVDGKWVCQYTEAASAVTRIFPRADEAFRHLRQRVAGSRSRYLIQQGLNLVKWDGRPVDFRVLIQKNGKGIWSVTSTVARVANDQNIVSNLARGGTLRKAGEVLAAVQAKNKPTLQQIRNKALSIVEAFERLSQGHYAELGVDLVLDQQGQLWLLELNSKPSKTDETVNPSTVIRPSVNRLVDYVSYITGWAPFLTTGTPEFRARPDRTRRKR